MAKDGVSDTHSGGGESGGGQWPGENDKPAHPDEGVVTHMLTEKKAVRDIDPSDPDDGKAGGN